MPAEIKIRKFGTLGAATVEIQDTTGKVLWSRVMDPPRRHSKLIGELDMSQAFKLRREAQAWCMKNGIELI